MSAIVPENISTPEMIRRRLRHSIDVYENIFECGYCDQKFKMKHNLISHEYIHQLNNHMRKYSEKPFVCNVCGKRFEKKADMDFHEIVHLERDIQKCSYCKKKYGYENHLQRHERIHEWIDSLNEPFECDDSVLIFQSVEESIDSQSQNSLYADALVSMPSSDVNTQPETSIDIVRSTEDSEANDSNTDDEPKSNSNAHTTYSKKRPRSPEPYYFQSKRHCSTEHQMADSSQAYQDHQISVPTKPKLICRCCDLKFEEIDQKLKHECLFHSPNVKLYSISLDVTENNNAMNSNKDIPSELSEPKVNKSRKRGRPVRNQKEGNLKNQNKSMQNTALKGSSRPKRKTRQNFNSSEENFNLSIEDQQYFADESNKSTNEPDESERDNESLSMEKSYQSFIEEKFKCCYCDSTFSQIDTKLEHECLSHSYPKVVLQVIDTDAILNGEVLTLDEKPLDRVTSRKSSHSKEKENSYPNELDMNGHRNKRKRSKTGGKRGRKTLTDYQQ